MNLEELRSEYEERKDEIDSRLQEFRELRNADDERLFKELVFVLLTSRTQAKKAWDAVEELDGRALLLNGDRDEISGILRKHEVQYEENKAGYIVENRKMLSQPTLTEPGAGLKLRSKLDADDLEKTREWLVENVKGIGWKGASHFLRNIGYGDRFAIVSGHIAKKLHQLDLIESSKPPESKDEYLETEQKMRRLSDETGIPAQELDLLLWSMETGEVFK